MATFTSLGFTPEQIQRARLVATKPNLRLARALESGKLQCASHVTREDALAWAARERKGALEIAQGKKDHNFTVWQRMNTYLTGVCVPFLS